MLKARIAVFVSGGGTNLQALIDAEHAGTIVSGEIALVVSNRRDAYALERAAAAGIDTVVEKDEDKLLALLRERHIDFIVLAGYLHILSPAFVAQFPERILNVHPSLIPSFCGKGCYGLHVHEKALAYGVKVSGATVHFVDEVPDGGKILLQKAVDVLDDDTPETLQKRIMESAEWILLPQATEMVAHEIVQRANAHPTQA